jgi:hypothetical protein
VELCQVRCVFFHDYTTECLVCRFYAILDIIAESFSEQNVSTLRTSLATERARVWNISCESILENVPKSNYARKDSC